MREHVMCLCDIKIHDIKIPAGISIRNFIRRVTIDVTSKYAAGYIS